MADRTVEYVPLHAIQRAPRNPKQHDTALIRRSVEDLGLVERMTRDDRTGRLVSGHGRLDDLLDRHAAGLAAPDGVIVAPDGTWLAPVVCGWASRNDVEAERALVVLNQAPPAGGWDPAGLDVMLRDLMLADVPPDLLGFGDISVDDLIGAMTPVVLPPVGSPHGAPSDASGSPDVPVPLLRSCPERAQRGDVWALGPHRIMCGDSRDADDVARLLDGASINVAFTSPPYADRRDYDEASGFTPIPPDEYVAWFRPIADNVLAHLAAEGSWFVNIKPGTTPDGDETEPYVLELVLAHRAWGWKWATEFCWERNGVPKNPARRFKNQFEPVYQFARGRWKFRPDNVRHWSENVPIPGGPGVGDTSWGNAQGGNGEMFGGARRRKNGTRELMADVQGTPTAPGEFIGPGMAYPGNRLPTFAGSHDATGHTAAFPVGLPGWFVKAFSDEGDMVYDPFMGSGSTLLAAHAHHRVGYGMELSARYVDLIMARWEQHTGIAPTMVWRG